MSDPVEPLKGQIIPNTGADVGSWGPVINGNFTALGGMFGGVTTVALTNTNVVLTKPTGTITPGAGPNQSQNAIIRLTGTLTANCNIQFPLPGFYIVENFCTVGAFAATANAPGAGQTVGLPPGRACHIYNDGTDTRFVNMPEVGSYLDLAISSVPAWMTACTLQPYLLCDGTVYNISSYPQLGALLGATFGGNGSTTFGVPDLRARYRLPLGGSTGRVTSGVSGIDGTTIASVGGDQRMQSHTHANTLSDPGHVHTFNAQVISSSPSGSSPGANSGTIAPPLTQTQSATTGITINNVSAGSGGSQNMPPTLVSGIALIKT